MASDDRTSSAPARGKYEAPNQIPIFVVDGGDLGDGKRGPWVKYRFPWETDDQATSVLFHIFDAMVEHAGYKHVAEGAQSDAR